jgi:sugar phosphate isomerase/epimerase
MENSGLMRLSRRDFIARGLVTSSALTLAPEALLSAADAVRKTPPIVVFTKVYQEVKLNFEESADITAEAGLDGVDSPVRPAGEVLPERAEEDLPKYVEMLRRRNLTLPLMTTAITSTGSPQAEALLRLAKKLGIQYYRLGFIQRQAEASAAKQMAEVRAQLKELVALNKEIGICGLLQNHSPAGSTVYFGGDLSELREAVEGFAPEQLGIAFDIGHALRVHGDDWRERFEKLRTHFKIAYVKDVQRKGDWVALGKGDIGKTEYFRLLKEMGYSAPVSLHIEYEWAENGKKNRDLLLKVLKENSQVLRGWLA